MTKAGIRNRRSEKIVSSASSTGSPSFSDLSIAPNRLPSIATQRFFLRNTHGQRNPCSRKFEDNIFRPNTNKNPDLHRSGLSRFANRIRLPARLVGTSREHLPVTQRFHVAEH